jgi:hypothetical protein
MSKTYNRRRKEEQLVGGVEMQDGLARNTGLL